MSSGSDGFTLVKYKYPKPNRIQKKQAGIPVNLRNLSTFPRTQSSCDDKQLELAMSNINQCKIELQESIFYKDLLLSLSELLLVGIENSEKVTTNWQDFVCYGIGKISECPKSRYQFALLLLLWKHFKPCGRCYIYDPVFGSLDEKIVENFGLELIPRNEEAKRKVSQKTLFFVPHGGKPLYNNILWANWGAGLENVVIFGNSFASYQERLPSHQLKSEACYIAQILPLTHEIEMLSQFNHDDIFNDMALHYFVGKEVHAQPFSFWKDCPEPIYEENNMEIILSV